MVYGFPEDLPVQCILHVTLIFSYSLACLAVQFTSLLEQLKSLLDTGVVVKGQQTQRFEVVKCVSISAHLMVKF